MFRKEVSSLPFYHSVEQRLTSGKEAKEARAAEKPLMPSSPVSGTVPTARLHAALSRLDVPFHRSIDLHAYAQQSVLGLEAQGYR